MKDFAERKLTYISSNETNYLAFNLPTEEYHNELYEELKFKYAEDWTIKRFDNEFFIQFARQLKNLVKNVNVSVYKILEENDKYVKHDDNDLIA